jgi:hypothetical protein
MLNKESDKPEGYEYPRPSIARGQSPTPSNTPTKPLSRENAEKLAKAIRDIGVKDALKP